MSNTFWQDRPTLVTGATGFVGGWLVRELLRRGADLVCIVRDWVPQSEFVQSRMIEKVKVVRGDVRNQKVLERVLAEYEVDTVFHLAAQTIVSIANRVPVSTLETNIQGTWALLEACRRCPNVNQIIVASTDKAYGDHETSPYTEEMPLAGKHPYDVSKSCADLIAQMFAATFNLPVAVTRCGNLYGGGDLNWNRIFPGTIRSVIRGERPIIRSDGQYVRDYFYVEDGVAAYIMLAEQLAARSDELRGQAFNFSSELQVTVQEVVRKILAQMRSSLEPDIRNSVKNEIRHQLLSAAKAKRVLGWRPLFSFEEGVAATVAWYQGFFDNEGKELLVGEGRH